MKSINKDLGVFIQAILLVILGILSILTLYIKQLVVLVELIIGLLLIVTGINNSRRYKRKFFTAIYIVCGITVIAFTLYSLVVNGI